MHPRHVEGGINMLLVVSFVIAGIVILMAVGVFAYGKFLRNTADQKAVALEDAQRKVNQDTVEGFLRLKNRLVSAENILTEHVALSQFFTVLENLTLESVRFSSLGITINPDHGADIKMTGTAKDFNALAAQSAAFAGDKRIKQAIFSGINSTKDGVTFSVAAKLDPRLVILPPADQMSAAAITAPTGSATSTP
jgi:hypothetical protein